MKKKLLVGAILILLSNNLAGIVYASTGSPIEQAEKEIQNSLEQGSSEEVTINDVDLDFAEGTVEVHATQDDTVEIDVVSELGIEDEEDTSFDTFTVTQTEDDVTKEYGLYFGTSEEKEELEVAYDDEQQMVDDILNDVYSEAELENLTLPLSEIFEDEENHISTVEELNDSSLTITDLDTGEIIEISPEDGIAANPIAIPVGIWIGKQVAKRLIKQGLAVLAKGVLNAAASYIAANSNTRRYYNHYRVIRNSKIGLVNVGGCNLNTATALIKTNRDVWSTSSTNAHKIAKYAGKNKTPIMEQAHKSGYYPHYHTFNRKGGHSFFGQARR